MDVSYCLTSKALLINIFFMMMTYRQATRLCIFGYLSELWLSHPRVPFFLFPELQEPSPSSLPALVLGFQKEITGANAWK